MVERQLGKAPRVPLPVHFEVGPTLPVLLMVLDMTGSALLPIWPLALDKAQFVPVPAEIGPRDLKSASQLQAGWAERGSPGHFYSCRWGLHPFSGGSTTSLIHIEPIW